MHTRFWHALGASALIAATPLAAWAGDSTGPGTFSASLGLLQLNADEIVYLYSGSSTELSHLFWSSTSPVLNADYTLHLPEGWTASVSGRLAGGPLGTGEMKDYDWISPPGDDYAFDNWTDRSISNNTLDYFVSVGLRLGHDLTFSDRLSGNVNVGIDYTDVKWTASGGDYIYSDGGFRNDSGTFPDIPVITYRQQWPALTGGLDLAYRLDAGVTLAAKARVGMVFLGADRDVHVFTATQYDEAFDPAPVAELGGEARFRLSSALDGVLAVNLKQIFTARGDTTMVDLTGTDPDEFYPDGAGGTLRELSLSAGISGQF